MSYLYVYIILFLYVYIIFCSIVYISSMKFIYKCREAKIIELKKTFGQDILILLYKIKSNDKELLLKEEVEMISKKLKYKIYSRVFSVMIIDFNNEAEENIIYTKIFMLYFEDYILRLLKIYRRTDSVKKVNIIYMLGNFGVNKEYINIFLLNKLNNKSFYIKFNTLNAIALIGDIDTFIKAMKYISDNKVYINNKLFTDIIHQYTGDIKILNERLFKEFKEFNTIIKSMLVDHFRYRKYNEIADELIDILSVKNLGDKELKASIIRYLASIKHRRAEKILIEILNGRQWELRAISVKTLSNYKSVYVEAALIKVLDDKNWNVRYNSAVALIENNVSISKIRKVIGVDNQIANEIISYVAVNKMLTNSKKIFSGLIKEVKV